MDLAHQYAQALHRAVQERGTDPKLFERLQAMLKRRGHYKLIPRIAAAYEKLTGQERHDAVHVRVAREQEVEQARKSAASLAPSIDPHVAIDEELVSGYTVQSRDFRFDASGRRTLIDLYRKLIA